MALAQSGAGLRIGSALDGISGSIPRRSRASSIGIAGIRRDGPDRLIRHRGDVVDLALEQLTLVTSPVVTTTSKTTPARSSTGVLLEREFEPPVARRRRHTRVRVGGADLLVLPVLRERRSAWSSGGLAAATVATWRTTRLSQLTSAPNQRGVDVNDLALGDPRVQARPHCALEDLPKRSAPQRWRTRVKLE
jgi:hypothetical protein